MADFLHRLSFGLKARAEAYQLLADFTASGMDLGVALETAGSIYRARGNESVHYILGEMRRSMAMGLGLRPALRRFAPQTDRLMFAGEGSIDSDAMFASVAKICRSQLAMRKAMLSAIAGPSMAIAALLGLYYLLGARMFPAFAQLAPIETWPLHSRMLAGVAIRVADGVLLAAPAVAIALFAVGWSARNWSGRGRVWADRIPPWSLYRLQTGLLFLMLLVESGRMGRNLNTAFLLDLARDAGPYVASRIRAIAHLTRNDPSGIGAAAQRTGQRWPDVTLAAALAAYSRQDNWLENFGDYLDRYAETADARARGAATTLNYVLTLMVAASLGGALLTVFGLIDQVQSSGF
ncbi:MAG: type II secretion system F family protein [Rhodospirillaceae bacterium]|nr:type II secretion system F family protein [Rhodospirillaceae bacterium]